MSSDQRIYEAAGLLDWLRSTGRRVWLDPRAGVRFDDEFGITPEVAERLLHASEDIATLLRAEQALARVRRQP